MKKILVLLTLSLGITLLMNSCKKDGVTTSATTEQQKVFNEFWEIYDKHYPLFHRKNIDWKNIYDTYYPQITATTTDAQLFATFKTIIGTVIKDGHTSLTFNTSQEAGYEPAAFNEDIEEMVQNNTPNKVTIISSSANNPYLSYGTVTSNPDIGYIQSKGFEPISQDFDTELTNFKAIVDAALIALQGKTGIIVDVRTNGGGQGPFAYYLAGRFFSTSGAIEIIRQRIKTSIGSGIGSLGNWATSEFIGYPDDRVEGGYVAGIFTDDNKISKSGAFQYTNKVAVLTANGTASAAEYFTIAMKTQPHIKSIGDKTFGIFAGSDIFTLKNGNQKWKTRVSTHDIEMKYNGSFQSFEGIGISPDELLIPTAAQVTAGDDVHINSAVNYIN